MKRKTPDKTRHARRYALTWRTVSLVAGTALSMAAIAGCHPIELLVVSNESQAPITVTANRPYPTSPDGQQLPCDLGRFYEDPVTHRNPDGSDLIKVARALEWVPIVGLTRDNEDCAHRFTLDQGFSAVIERDYVCHWTTDVAGLTIESRARRFEWHGDKATWPFEKRKHVCIYRYREP